MRRLLLPLVLTLSLPLVAAAADILGEVQGAFKQLLPFDLMPKFTKQTNTVRAAYALPGSGAVTGGFTQSSSENDNAGMGAVAEWRAEAAADGRELRPRDIPYPETRAYVEKVLRAQEQYRERYGRELGPAP